MSIRQTINEYDPKQINQFVFSQYTQTSYQANRERLELLNSNLKKRTNNTIFISLGENCGPSICLKKAGLDTLGSSYFDNIVTPTDTLSQLFRSSFSDTLQLTNLTIGTWEGQDSVFDEATGIYFHHYFHLRGAETKFSTDPETGVAKRIIDHSDIPLFYPLVKSQFEYLAQKFLIIARHDAPKVYVIRRIDGNPLKAEKIQAINEALKDAGAVNFRLAQVINESSRSQVEPIDAPNIITWPIEMSTERWGARKSWRINAYAAYKCIILKTSHGTYLHKNHDGSLFHDRLGSRKEGLIVTVDAKRLTSQDAGYIYPGARFFIKGRHVSIGVHDRWICADQTGSVVADRTKIGAREKFVLEETPSPPSLHTQH